MAGEDRPLKVCHVFAGTEGGRWVCEQLAALRSEGCEGIALLGGEEGPTVDMCRAAGVAVESFDMRIFGLNDMRMHGIRPLIAFPLRIIRLALWMRRNRIDVVQSHVISSTFFARPAAWLADVPVRLTMSTTPFYLQAPSIRWMEKATSWMETGVIPSCALTADLYREAGITERLIQPTLYYGPDAERFDPGRTAPEGLREELGLPPDTPLIGSIAVFYPKCSGSSFVPAEVRNRYIKGHTDLIQAMHGVLPEFPKARLVLIGRGWGPNGPAIDEDLRDFVSREGLDHVVHFAGWRDSTPAVYMDLDVSVQAAINENLGGTIESLLMARPTVATRVGGMVDSVVDGETGILVDPGDPADLARGINEMLRDPERAARLGRAGRALMLSSFTLATTVPGLAAIYRRQHEAARGAFRIHVSLWRLFVGALLAVPVLLRAAAEIFLFHVAPMTIRQWRDRWRRRIGGRQSSAISSDTGPRATILPPSSRTPRSHQSPISSAECEASTTMLIPPTKSVIRR